MECRINISRDTCIKCIQIKVAISANKQYKAYRGAQAFVSQFACGNTDVLNSFTIVERYPEDSCLHSKYMRCFYLAYQDLPMIFTKPQPMQRCLSSFDSWRIFLLCYHSFKTPLAYLSSLLISVYSKLPKLACDYVHFCSSSPRRLAPGTLLW